MRAMISGLACVLGLASCGMPTPPGPLMDRSMPVSAGQVDDEPTARHVVASIENKIPATSRCYPLTTERVVFKVYHVKSDYREDWDAQAKKVPETCDGTRVWHDKWYWYYLPPKEVDNLMLVWRNIDRHEYGYVVVKNTPTVWLVYDNKGGPWTPGNDQQIKRTWHTDGRRIDIDVKNPKNESGWTANDIWVSFGF